MSRQQVRTLADRHFLLKLGEIIRSELEVLHAGMLAPGRARASAEYCIATAKGYGFETERAIMAFTLWMLRINPMFHSDPQIREVLAKDLVDSETKIQTILSPDFDAAWRRAEHATDPRVFWMTIGRIDSEAAAKQI